MNGRSEDRNGALSLGVVDGDLAIYIEAGMGVALAIDLAISLGSASITLKLAISTDQKPFVLAITLVGQAEIDIARRLVSASLTLSTAISCISFSGWLRAAERRRSDGKWSRSGFTSASVG